MQHAKIEALDVLDEERRMAKHTVVVNRFALRRRDIKGQTELPCELDSVGARKQRVAIRPHGAGIRAAAIRLAAPARSLRNLRHAVYTVTSVPLD